MDKCQTTAGVGGGGLRGNLHPRVCLYTPHEDKRLADSCWWLSVSADVRSGVDFMTHTGEIWLLKYFSEPKLKETGAI